MSKKTRDREIEEILRSAEFSGSTRREELMFIRGVGYADANPDQERISKFTSNLMDENLRLTKKASKYRKALEWCKQHLEGMKSYSYIESALYQIEEALEEVRK